MQKTLILKNNQLLPTPLYKSWKNTLPRLVQSIRYYPYICFLSFYSIPSSVLSNSILGQYCKKSLKTVFGQSPNHHLKKKNLIRRHTIKVANPLFQKKHQNVSLLFKSTWNRNTDILTFHPSLSWNLSKVIRLHDYEILGFFPKVRARGQSYSLSKDWHFDATRRLTKLRRRRQPYFNRKFPHFIKTTRFQKMNVQNTLLERFKRFLIRKTFLSAQTLSPETDWMLETFHNKTLPLIKTYQQKTRTSRRRFKNAQLVKVYASYGIRVLKNTNVLPAKHFFKKQLQSYLFKKKMTQNGQKLFRETTHFAPQRVDYSRTTRFNHLVKIVNRLPRRFTRLRVWKLKRRKTKRLWTPSFIKKARVNKLLRRRYFARRFRRYSAFFWYHRIKKVTSHLLTSNQSKSFFLKPKKLRNNRIRKIVLTKKKKTINVGQPFSMCLKTNMFKTSSFFNTSSKLTKLKHKLTALKVTNLIKTIPKSFNSRRIFTSRAFQTLDKELKSKHLINRLVNLRLSHLLRDKRLIRFIPHYRFLHTKDTSNWLVQRSQQFNLRRLVKKTNQSLNTLIKPVQSKTLGVRSWQLTRKQRVKNNTAVTRHWFEFRLKHLKTVSYTAFTKLNLRVQPKITTPNFLQLPILNFFTKQWPTPYLLPQFRPYHVAPLSRKLKTLAFKPFFSLTFHRTIFFFTQLINRSNSLVSDLITPNASRQNLYRYNVFPDANALKVQIFRYIRRQKTLFNSRIMRFNALKKRKLRTDKHFNSKLINYLDLDYSQFSSTHRNQQPLRYLSKLHSTLRSQYKMKNENIRIKRVRFKPGYGRIWRQGRQSIRELTNLPSRYQYRLTPKLHWLYLQDRKTSKSFSTRTLDYVLMASQLLPDFWCVKEALNSNLVFLNGSQVQNPNIYLFLNDFVQLTINLKFYFLSKWLKYWSIQKRNRVNRIFHSKHRPSGTNKQIRFTRTLPVWFYDLRFSYRDVPKHVEVDFFTLSLFVFTNPRAGSFTEPRRANLYDSSILNMYNWKYIT